MDKEIRKDEVLKTFFLFDFSLDPNPNPTPNPNNQKQLAFYKPKARGH